jgi:hypothetical protein
MNIVKLRLNRNRVTRLNGLPAKKDTISSDNLILRDIGKVLDNIFRPYCISIIQKKIPTRHFQNAIPIIP